jgi:flagellar biosynthesis protein FlhG
MRPISEQNHYDILEVASNAAPDEIERAFRMAQATYSDDSLAGYSVFGEGEAQAIRERIEIAFRVLSDAESRSAYDASLAGVESPAASETLEPGGFTESFMPSVEFPPPIPLEEMDTLEDEEGEFDGARLRRSRLHRGIELEDISSRTKISPSYLRFIEEDRYADLPAPVYVRGFVTAYANCLGLDPKEVAASYMKNFEDQPPTPRRGRFLASR